MPNTLHRSIQLQRDHLEKLLDDTLRDYATAIIPLLHSPAPLDEHLRVVFTTLDHCKYLYVLDSNGVQISSTINRFGADTSAHGRDRSQRPYMQHIQDENINFKLSEAYISRNKKRPSLTAIQTIRTPDGQRVGFLGVDYDLRELPHSNVIYEEPSQWRQIKGDPAIRQGLFHQERVESLMDQHIDHVLSVHQSLIVDQGVHHFQIHFSSSRSTIWHIDDPYIYRILTMDLLVDTNICLAYPRRPYFERAVVPRQDISRILQQFKALRFADEVIYLRSGSLNIVNGTVGLNFSCDGSHYLQWDEFLDKGLAFWFGSASAPQSAGLAIPLDQTKLDAAIETIAATGCIAVNQLLHAIEQNQTDPRLLPYSPPERDYIYRELKAVMDVYDGGVCGI